MLSRNEALEILGVTGKSLETDIEMRYAMLIKRYRAEQNNEKLEEIALAYNIVTGRYVEPVPVDPKMQKVVLGKTRAEWKNIWFYGKVKYFVIAVIAAFVVYLIYTVATNTPADFKIAAVGSFNIPETEITENYAKTLFPEFKKVEVASAYMGSSMSGEYSTANAQKAMILMTVSGEDVIVVDRSIFNQYASMGAFVAMDDLYQSVSALDSVKGLSVKPVTATVKDDSSGTGKEKIYGLDLSSTQLLSGLGIYGSEQILVISVKTSHQALAEEFIKKTLSGGTALLPKVTWVPTAAPTPIPTPTTKPTP